MNGNVAVFGEFYAEGLIVWTEEVLMIDIICRCLRRCWVSLGEQARSCFRGVYCGTPWNLSATASSTIFRLVGKIEVYGVGKKAA